MFHLSRSAKAGRNSEFCVQTRWLSLLQGSLNSMHECTQLLAYHFHNISDSCYKAVGLVHHATSRFVCLHGCGQWRSCSCCCCCFHGLVVVPVVVVVVVQFPCVAAAAATTAAAAASAATAAAAAAAAAARWPSPARAEQQAARLLAVTLAVPQLLCAAQRQTVISPQTEARCRPPRCCVQRWHPLRRCRRH
eukprot:352455-Chlamydomonas_euryale.AAC.5